MCNHYRSDPDKLSTWAEYAGFKLRADRQVDGDIWPKREAPVVRAVDGVPALDILKWGVPTTVPGKRPGTKLKKHVTNVRNLASPFWRSMLANPAQRCLVPFSRFAEPVIGGGRSEHWFSIVDRPMAAFAGIWRPSEDGEVFAFLTCEPNSLVAPLHPKAMPVILAEDDYEAWLTGSTDRALGLAQAFPSQLMRVESPS